MRNTWGEWLLPSEADVNFLREKNKNTQVNVCPNQRTVDEIKRKAAEAAVKLVTEKKRNAKTAMILKTYLFKLLRWGACGARFALQNYHFIALLLTYFQNCKWVLQVLSKIIPNFYQWQKFIVEASTYLLAPNHGSNPFAEQYKGKAQKEAAQIDSRNREILNATMAEAHNPKPKIHNIIKGLNNGFGLKDLIQAIDDISKIKQKHGLSKGDKDYVKQSFNLAKFDYLAQMNKTVHDKSHINASKKVFSKLSDEIDRILT
jgi:hypothetical protein